MVRPSAASLNSLANLLRQAQPLYRECRSIINYLDSGDGIVSLPSLEDTESGPASVPPSKDADSLPPDSI